MTERISIASPRLLQIRDGGALHYGANQDWYPRFRQRLSGCGPTSASNLLWYLAATRPGVCGGLFDGDATERGEMLRLMESVWRYITPGLRGLHRHSLFVSGALRCGQEHGSPLSARVLEVPKAAAARPGADEALEFLSSAFSDDLPVAFLNLSNGGVAGLDGWHWVTLVSVDAALRAEMYDQSSRSLIDLRLWLESTTKGGALIALEPQA